MDELPAGLSRPNALAHFTHKEALNLEWLSQHLPYGTIPIGILSAIIVASAVFTIIAKGPRKPMP